MGCCVGSLNEIQNMINSASERQGKSTDELLRRLIEERDEKNMMIVSQEKNGMAKSSQFFS
jgi:hypothetical protein